MKKKVKREKTKQVEKEEKKMGEAVMIQIDSDEEEVEKRGPSCHCVTPGCERMVWAIGMPCALCALEGILEKAEAEYDAAKVKIVKIEVDPNPDLVEKYAVYGLPTIMLFKNGEPVEGSKREGAINLPKLKDHLTAFGVEA